ncbi:MAG TPA: glycosyltransferase [Saprospiraceae bacterium]|nr:glycosyltransferase [Saprospiraceae bacterium]
MKGLFYFRTHRNDPANQGVVGKCEAYVQAFTAQGIDADVIWYDEEGLVFNDRKIVVSFPGNRKKSVGHFLTFYRNGDRRLAHTLNFREYDFIVIRHMPTHRAFLKLLEKAKKTNPRIRIIIELPTWPYDAEMKGPIGSFMLTVDRLYRARLREFTDRFLHYGPEEGIWGVPAIFVQNGISVGRIPPPVALRPEPGLLRMTFIGSMGYWHGLDRLLEGMRIFLDKKNAGTQPAIHLKILGNGAESEEIRALVARLGLQHHVTLIPPKNGKEFDALMAQTDLGIGTLATHRIGLALNSALKHRTYCAYGLPFLFAGEDADFPANFPFSLRIPGDESPVQMEELIGFVEDLHRQYPDAAPQIRAYAEAQLDWTNKIKPVLEYLLNLHAMAW